MVPVGAHAGHRVCVLRLTEAGLGAAQALACGGAEVTVWDEDEARRTMAARLGLSVEDPSTRDWSDLSAIVVGEASMLDDQVSIRALDMAAALDIPVVDATTLIARALVTENALTVCVLSGHRASVLAELTRGVFTAMGVDVIGPGLNAPPRVAGPGTIALLALEEGPVPILPDILAATSVIDADTLIDTLTTMTGPVVLNADDAAAARLATRAPTRSILASGRQSLGGGVFVCAGSVFDGVDGPPRRLNDAPGSDAIAFTPPDLLAMAHALVRAAGFTLEQARDGLAQFEGLAGWGKPQTRFGPVPVLDYSQAKDLRSAVMALRGPGPVIWIAGSTLEKGAGALIEAKSLTPSAIYLSGDRCKAARGLSRLCPTHVISDIDLLAARALFAALNAGPDTRIVVAPGCETGVEPVDIATALDRLKRAVRQGEAV
jgi:UDP-N-acetylmuramoylalanine--D-glutamate ligase